VCVFIWVSAHMCMSICVCTVFLKKSWPRQMWGRLPSQINSSWRHICFKHLLYSLSLARSNSTLKWLFVYHYSCPPMIFSHFYHIQGMASWYQDSCVWWEPIPPQGLKLPRNLGPILTQIRYGSLMNHKEYFWPALWI
jgi:hypothetical protein